MWRGRPIALSMLCILHPLLADSVCYCFQPSLWCMVQSTEASTWIQTCWSSARSIHCVEDRWHWLASPPRQWRHCPTESSFVVVVRSSCSSGSKPTERSIQKSGLTTPLEFQQGDALSCSVEDMAKLVECANCLLVMVRRIRGCVWRVPVFEDKALTVIIISFNKKLSNATQQ